MDITALVERLRIDISENGAFPPMACAKRLNSVVHVSYAIARWGACLDGRVADPYEAAQDQGLTPPKPPATRRLIYYGPRIDNIE